MTVRIERSTEIAAAPERVWEFIADPERRSRAISVVDSYTVEDPETERIVWHLKLPIKWLRNVADVTTETVERDPPRFVRFVGRSRVMRVTGEHELREIDDGTELISRFTVDGRVPGVESFFKHNLDGELENIEDALRADLGIDR